jgi:hypothetical protein
MRKRPQPTPIAFLADRQFLQRDSFLIDALGIARVAAANDLVDEAPPCRKKRDLGLSMQANPRSGSIG